MTVTCPYLRNATKLAHKKGLLPKKEVLECKIEATCDQVDCLKLEDPNFRTLYIKQSETIEIPSRVDKFYGWVEKSLQIRYRGRERD